MENTQEAKLAVRKPELGDGGHFWCAISVNRASLGKTPWEGKSPSAQSHGKPRNRREGIKVKGGSRVPKNCSISEASLGSKWIWQKKNNSIQCTMRVRQMRDKTASHHALTVEKFNHAKRVNTVGSRGSRSDDEDCARWINWIWWGNLSAVHKSFKSDLTVELVDESFHGVTEIPNRWGWASAVHERTSGHSLWDVGDDAEVGNSKWTAACDLKERKRKWIVKDRLDLSHEQANNRIGKKKRKNQRREQSKKIWKRQWSKRHKNREPNWPKVASSRQKAWEVQATLVRICQELSTTLGSSH